MYERIVEQAASRFSLSREKTKQLLGMLVGQIFNPKRGGPAGFVKAFRDQGLGDVVGSWLGRGRNQSITPSQLESVLGADAISSISAKLGLSRETVGSAAAALLPDAVDTLSEHGDLGTGIPDKLKGWLGNVLEELGHFGSLPAAAETSAVGAGAAAVGSDQATDDTARAAGGGWGKWLPWLLIGALLVVAFVYFRG